MEIKSLLLTLVALISFCSVVHSFEPNPLQDFCVADTDSSVRVNGFVCRNPMLAQASDFSLMGLNLPGNTLNPLGSAITPATVAQIPGLNTLGVSMVRIGYAPWGLKPPHIHPCATEIFTILKGTLEDSFIMKGMLGMEVLSQLLGQAAKTLVLSRWLTLFSDQNQ
ncbi:germin-like protein 8-12 isoform X2 [Camellia sinensis]|uniref:germin-like protein 8-12 isoform X2 n=1 Tax=Camellia sinensis TaxID=4442 RepID=UPI001035C7CC|nr:germin-like protein 8-12 isoform X2 [Camellia sinensis]